MRCCVSHCLNISDKVSTSEGKGRVKQEAISFHGFPKEARLRAAWLKALCKQESHLNHTAVVCSQHFLSDDVCETERGTKLLRRGAVPSTVQVCMMCLDTDSPMFLMRKHKFDDAYEKLTGHPLWNGGNLKQTLCVQCAQRLRNFSRFREQSLRARSLMMELLEKHTFITINHIRTIKRKLNNNFSYHYDSKVEPEGEEKEIFDDDADNKVKSELSDDSMWDFDDEGDDTDTKEEADDAGSDGEVFVELTPTCTKYDPLLSKLLMKNENEEDNSLIKTEPQIEANNDESDMKSSENEIKTTDLCTVERESTNFDNQNIENASKDKDDEENDPDISETLQELYNQPIEANNEANVKETWHWESDFSDCTLSSISWGDEVYTCDICQKTFRDMKRLTQHIKAHSTNEKSLSCNLCNYKSRLKSQLENHLRTHASGKLYSCTICSKGFSLKCSLSRHMRSHKEKHITCTLCSYKTSRRDRLSYHMKTHTGETRYACQLCTYKSFHNSDLVKHMRTHTGEKPYPCEFCGLKFGKKNTLTRHTLRLHTREGETPFKCSICDFQCYYQGRFIKHMKTHPTNQTHSCRLCEYTCHSETQLKRHTKTHTGVNYYSCEYCDFTVNFKSKLVRHIQTHTGERAFKCTTCNRAFLEKSKLTRHMKIHSDEKPFACTSCPYRCRRNSNLEKHKKTHARENRFSCEVCPFKCARISALTRHMRSHK